MLAPDSRAVLLDQLRPPLGFGLEHAVGTTFTLDLTYALLPPLAFAATQVDPIANPMAVMAAVHEVAGRIDLFCQAGNVAVPSSGSDLYAFLEPMVHPVQQPRPGHLFHPKVWFLKFRNDENEVSYRLLVLSRNLTPEATWDTLVSLDGTPGSRPDQHNRPLHDLLMYLSSAKSPSMTDSRRERIVALAQEMRRVVWVPPSDVSQIDFHLFGVTGAPAKPDFSGYRNLVVSPFVTDKGLEGVVDPRWGDVRVVSRPEALDALLPKTLKYINNPQIVNPLAELLDVPEDEAARTGEMLSALHAKLFVTERAGAAHLFLGSLNATEAALRGNIEFLVELKGPIKQFGVDALLGPEAIGPILEPYAAVGGQDPDPQEEEQYRLDEQVRALAAMLVNGLLVRHDDQYEMAVCTDDLVVLQPGFQASASLHTLPGWSADIEDNQKLSLTFGPMVKADITAFLMVRVTSPGGLVGGTAILMRLIGDPADRLDEVLARQLDSMEKFLQFLALLLGLGPGNALLLLGGTALGAGANDGSVLAAGLFETLLRVLADRPEALDSLDDLIQRLAGDENRAHVLPPGLIELWPALREAQVQLVGAAK